MNSGSKGEASGRKKTSANKRRKMRRFPVSRRGRTAAEQAKGILDPGTDFELLGGVGWEIIEKLDTRLQLNGALEGMAGTELPIITGVAAYDPPGRVGETVLLGVGAAAWDERIVQTESLLNSHVMRENNVEVDDKAKSHGGQQRIVVDGIKIDLIFEDNRLLYIPLRRPTRKEMNELRGSLLSTRSFTLRSGVHIDRLIQRGTSPASFPSPRLLFPLLRIRTEMAFGLMVKKWGILQRPLSIKIKNVKYMVTAIAQLHNFVIQERLAGINYNVIFKPKDVDLSVYQQTRRLAAADIEFEDMNELFHSGWSRNRDRMAKEIEALHKERPSSTLGKR